ncbi:MAG: zinc ABC transporter substrate-binding protein [Hyphomicrobiales bacterium]|nr:zinc ABC transporter substrate-binding protein [Hyphomicrobiales bacterium]
MKRVYGYGALTFAAAVALASGLVMAGEREGVVASIKPVHSLVSAVMQGVATPHLIVKGGASPHTYSLKPSDAKALEHAKVVFWIGEDLETFLEKSIDTLGEGAKVVALDDAHGLTKLPFREGGPFEAHDDGHEGHGHKKKAAKHDHDDHGHKKKAKHDHHDHGHKKKSKHDHHDHGHKKEAKHDHDGHAGHAHGDFDMHLWLDPLNAKAMVHEIEEALVAADPANASKYKANAKALETRLEALTKELAQTLAPVKGRPFIVFHDAYQYFEKRFGLTAAGSITVSPETLPGARRVADIQAKVKKLGATCVFAEPQFEPKLVRVVTEGTRAKSGVLDPVGAGLTDGPELYFTLMRNMAQSMKSCLSPES